MDISEDLYSVDNLFTFVYIMRLVKIYEKNERISIFDFGS